MNNYNQFELDTVEKYNRFFSSIPGFGFMNDGYVELDQHGFPTVSTDNELAEQFQPWRYQAQLYKKCLDVARIDRHADQGTLLDLSCGKGGGLAFIKEHYKFNKLIGVDLNPNHINLCQNAIKDVEFLTGSALAVPLANNSVDAIITVEATAYYDPFENYIKETYRLLEPGGLLIQASPDPVNINLYADQGFKLNYIQNITKNVRMACAISKYIMADMDESGTLFDCLLGDETRYINNNSLYNIMVFSK
jgi:ubiquinone/menaquinone biosynthesis C-methylase UbiE